MTGFTKFMTPNLKWILSLPLTLLCFQGMSILSVVKTTSNHFLFFPWTSTSLTSHSLSNAFCLLFCLKTAYSDRNPSSSPTTFSVYTTQFSTVDEPDTKDPFPFPTILQDISFTIILALESPFWTGKMQPFVDSLSLSMVETASCLNIDFSPSLSNEAIPSFSEHIAIQPP